MLTILFSMFPFVLFAALVGFAAYAFFAIRYSMVLDSNRLDIYRAVGSDFGTFKRTWRIFAIRYINKPMLVNFEALEKYLLDTDPQRPLDDNARYPIMKKKLGHLSLKWRKVVCLGCQHAVEISSADWVISPHPFESSFSPSSAKWRYIGNDYYATGDLEQMEDDLVVMRMVI